MPPNSPNPPPRACPICYEKARPGRFTCSSKCADEWFSTGTGSKYLQGYGLRNLPDVVHRAADGSKLRGPR